jgi:hypothetical protein
MQLISKEKFTSRSLRLPTLTLRVKCHLGFTTATPDLPSASIQFNPYVLCGTFYLPEDFMTAFSLYPSPCHETHVHTYTHTHTHTDFKRKIIFLAGKHIGIRIKCALVKV